MEVIELVDLDPTVAAPAVLARGAATSIGAYDGVHLGHRALIARTREEAARLGCASAVVTFDRHPATVVRPESAPRLLTDLDQKLELLADTGVDVTVVVHFDRRRAAEEPEDFVAEVLVGLLRTRAVVVGRDFHFGRGRRGDVGLLRDLGARSGFGVIGLDLVADGGTAVSSTRIRELISAGRVDEAAALLGRHHEVRGVVGRGDGRGRELGFPTANLAVPAELALPADGVYAGWYRGPDGAARAACVSVGRRPTFYADGAPQLVEAYLLDFAGDLYAQHARVELVARQRGQARFDAVDALVAQMRADVEATRGLLAVPAPAAPPT